MIFLISDTHFKHDAIGRYCHRVEGWNELIIKMWNKWVKPTDAVVHLGDFGFGPSKVMAKIRQKLAGRLIMVKGNHDKSVGWLRKLGAAEVLASHGDDVFIDDHEFPAKIICATKPSLPTNAKEKDIIVSHAPLPNIRWPYFYGHIHNNPLAWDENYMPYPLGEITGRNMCVEVTNYQPCPLPPLLNDVKWIKEDWSRYLREFFGIGGGAH
jgi:calcineurin-like phosphoesterase family protein